MARFSKLRSGYFNEGSTSGAELSYLANMAKTFNKVEKANFSLDELRLKSDWTDRTNQYDQTARDGNYLGAYNGYTKVIDEQIAHLKELQSNPNIQEDDLLRYEIKMSNLYDRRDSVQEAYQNKLAAGAVKAEATLKKSNKAFVNEKLATFEFQVDNAWKNWMNRDKINETEVTGSYVDNWLWGMVNDPDSGMLSLIDGLLDNKDSLDDGTIAKLEKKRNDIENAIDGQEESANSPFYKLTDRVYNPDGWYDSINPSSGKLMRTDKMPQVWLGNVGVDVANYYHKYGTHDKVKEGEETGRKLPSDVVGKLQIKVPDPNNPLRTIALAWDEFEKNPNLAWTIYDEVNNTSQPFDKNNYQYKSLNKQVARDSETGQLYIIENNKRRPLNPETDGDIAPEIYNTQIISHGVLEGFEELPPLELPDQNILDPAGEYRKEQDESGGFNFYNPDNNPVSVEEYSGATGIGRDEALRGSTNQQDQPNLTTQRFLNPGGSNSVFKYGFPKSRGYGGIF